MFFGKEPEEQFENICVVRSGKINEKSWVGDERFFDFFDIKADLSSVLNCLDMDINNFDMTRSSKSYYHPGKSGSLLISDEKVGFFGELSPVILNSFDIKDKLVAFELNLTKYIFLNLNNTLYIIIIIACVTVCDSLNQSTSLHTDIH